MMRAVAWVFGILFLFVGIVGSISTVPNGVYVGLGFIAAGLFTLPPLWRSGVASRVPGWARWAGAIVSLIAFSAASKTDVATSQISTSPQEIKAASIAPDDGKPLSFTPPPQPVFEDEGASASGAWEYNTSSDEMRGQVTYFACVTSENELQFEFPYNGGASAQLCFRSSPKFGKDVYVKLSKGQFNCSSVSECSVSAKFDDRPISEFSAIGPSDGSTETLFIKNYSRFLASTRSSKYAVIEAEYFRHGDMQLRFPTSGLKWDH
jgi:hypothetical protein